MTSDDLPTPPSVRMHDRIASDLDRAPDWFSYCGYASSALCALILCYQFYLGVSDLSDSKGSSDAHQRGAWYVEQSVVYLFESAYMALCGQATLRLYGVAGRRRLSDRTSIAVFFMASVLLCLVQLVFAFLGPFAYVEHSAPSAWGFFLMCIFPWLVLLAMALFSYPCLLRIYVDRIYPTHNGCAYSAVSEQRLLDEVDDGVFEESAVSDELSEEISSPSDDALDN